MQTPWPYGGRPSGPAAPGSAPQGYDVPGPGSLESAPYAGYGYAARPRLKARELFDILLRGWWIIAATTVVGVAVGAYHVFSQPHRYSASSVLLVEKAGNQMSGMLPIDPRGSFRNERNLSNELLYLRQSEVLADSVARRLIAFGRVPGTGEPLTIVGDPATASVEVVARRLLRGGYMRADPEGRDVDAVRISATSTEPGEAALIANLYAQAFVRRTRESSRASVSAGREFLEEQVEAQAATLTSADEAVRRFMVAEGAVALDEESSRLVAQLAQLQAQRDEANVEVRMKSAYVAELERELVGIEPRLAARLASGADREIETTQTRIAQLEAHLDQVYLRSPGLRDNPNPPADVAEQRRELERLRGRVRELSQRLLEESLAAGGGGPGDQGSGIQRAADLRRRLTDERIALSGLEAQREVLTARIADYQRQIRTLPNQAIELAQLQRDRLAAEGLYQALDQKLQEARLTERGELGYAEVVQGAHRPSVPFSPNRKRGVLLGLLFGLGLGVGLAVLRVRLDDRIHRPLDLKAAGFTVLATIPDLRALIKEEFEGRPTVEVDGVTYDTGLTSLLTPMATASEAFRELRTSVQFSRPDTVVQTILVTSSMPGEGKTTIAANLAVVMAQAGRRVLLIDADLRRPRVHRVFGLTKQPGLVQLLFPDAASESWHPVTVAENLSVLPAGSDVPNPSELLGSASMRELIAGLRDYYDVLIFDAPPVQAATDAVLLSPQCDATILVAMAGKASMEEFRETKESLDAVGAHTIGVVLNRFALRSAYGYKYKYKYRYGRTYGYGAERATSKWFRKARPAR